MKKDARLENIEIKFGDNSLFNGVLNDKMMQIVDMTKKDYEKRHPMNMKVIQQQEEQREAEYYESVRKAKNRKKIC